MAKGCYGCPYVSLCPDIVKMDYGLTLSDDGSYKLCQAYLKIDQQEKAKDVLESLKKNSENALFFRI